MLQINSALIIFTILTFNQSIMLSFARGTLVKTPEGYTRIENLRIGDAVIGYDPAMKKYIKNHIIDTAYNAYHSYVTIPIDNICIKTTPDQLFYQRRSPKTQNSRIPEWVKACNIADYDIYTPHSRVPFYSVVSVEDAPTPLTFYYLLLHEPHTLCITHSDVIVHNGIPLLGICSVAFNQKK